MPRRLGVCLAVFALLYGLSVAPFTHAHHAIDSVADEHHRQGSTLVHSHTAAHSHRHTDPLDPQRPPEDDEHDRIWFVNSFVCQQLVLDHAPAPFLLPCGESSDELTTAWSATSRTQAKAHGPPLGLVSSLRAPPPFQPATV